MIFLNLFYKLLLLVPSSWNIIGREVHKLNISFLYIYVLYINILYYV